jgi:hypothetical protein
VVAFNDAALTRIFAHEILSLLMGRGLISTEIATKILSWRHTGFNVHSRVRTATLKEAQRVARYMAKPVVTLSRLTFDEAHGKVRYRLGKSAGEYDELDYLDFIARLTSHIPEKGQVMVRYYGIYSNAHRGSETRRGQASPLLMSQPPPATTASPGWREMIKQVYEVDPLICPTCGSEMKVIAFITNYEVIDKIIDHLRLTFKPARPPPSPQQEELY